MIKFKFSSVIFSGTVRVVAGLFLAACLSLPQLKASDFFVATNGNDANAGTLSAPFQTLPRARSAVRAALSSATNSITVQVREGTYYLRQPLEFTPADSGSAIVPVTYTAYTNETVILSGAVKLTPDWTAYSGNSNIMVADVGTNLDIDGLFINGTQQVLARYPNYRADTIILNGYAPHCLASNRVARWANPVTGLVRGLHGGGWGGNSFKITGVDSKGQPVLRWMGDNNRGDTLNKKYRLVENIFEELDTTTEWFYNRTTGHLYFWPPTGLNLAKATVEAATLSELVGFRGESTNNVVSHITLSNFSFTQTHRTLFNTSYEGLMRGDWAVARAGTIFMSNTEHLLVQNCVFTNVGGNAIFLSAYNRNDVINNNDFVNIGATCVQVVGLMSATRYPSTWANPHQEIQDTTVGPLTEDYPENITISSNYMSNLGVFEKQSAGINISVASGVTVSHNTIHRSPRSGININDGCFGGHIIEFNDVWDCVRETSDHGPFNSWGRDRYWSYGRNGMQKRPYAFLDCQQPTIIRNNRFQYATVETWGIDLDDGSSNYQIYNNVCLNTGFKLRDGFGRHVYNNIIINQGGNFHVWPDECRDQVDHNIIVNRSPWSLIGLNAGNLAAKQAMIDTNFFWNSGREILLPFAGWNQLGFDVHSLTADPQFKDVAGNDFTVQNQQILALGFTNIPMNFGRGGAPRPPPIAIEIVAAAKIDAGTFMGATITGIDSDGIISATGLGDTNGVYLASVPAGSAAASQGFLVNDVIRQINGRTVTGQQSFRKLYDSIIPGANVKLVLWRNQAEQSLSFNKPGAAGSEP